MKKVNPVPVVAWYRAEVPGTWYKSTWSFRIVVEVFIFDKKALNSVIRYYSKSVHKHGIVSTPINTIFKSFSQNANRVQILILLKSLIKAVK